MAKTKQLSTPTKLDRWFRILQIVLFCMPFVYLAYLRVGTGGASLQDEGVHSGNPAMAVTLLAAMLQPYVGWLLMLCQRRLADGRTPYAVVNMTLLLIAELMTMSSVGVVGLGLILFKTVRTYGMGPSAAWRAADKTRLFAECGGSVLVLLLALLLIHYTWHKRFDICHYLLIPREYMVVMALILSYLIFH